MAEWLCRCSQNPLWLVRDLEHQRGFPGRCEDRGQDDAGAHGDRVPNGPPSGHLALPHRRWRPAGGRPGHSRWRHPGVPQDKPQHRRVPGAARGGRTAQGPPGVLAHTQHPPRGPSHQGSARRSRSNQDRRWRQYPQVKNDESLPRVSCKRTKRMEEQPVSKQLSAI